MKTASEYRQNAEDCRKMASAFTGEQREQLLRMAVTWERLAEEREALVKAEPRSFRRP